MLHSRHVPFATLGPTKILQTWKFLEPTNLFEPKSIFIKKRLTLSEPKLVWTNKNSDLHFFADPESLRPTIFVDPQIFEILGPNIFETNKFSDLNFFADPQSLRPTIFVDPQIFETQIYGTQHF